MTDATDTLNADLVTPDEAAVLAAIAGTSPEATASKNDLEAQASVIDGLGLTETELVDAGIMPSPVIAAEPLAPQPESWRACTGPDVQAMIKAHGAGFERTPGFTRADVYAFLTAKGL